MADLGRLRIVVAGGGVVGWTTALWLARAGASVTLAEPEPEVLNASAVAAGMLAPAFESIFDALSERDSERLFRARDLWPALAGSIGLELSRCGALAVGPDEQLEAWAAQASARGLAMQRLGHGQASTLAPGLRASVGGLFSADDWRLDARVGLERLRRAAQSAGVAVRGSAVADFAAGRVRFSDGAGAGADILVIATGASPALGGIAPEILSLEPVKGQILTARAAPAPGPAVRFKGGYVCPAAEGVIIGASMEAGRADATIDPAVTEGLVARASAFLPHLAGIGVEAHAGVRAATPDGAPMVGPAGAPGVWLAVGVRRNGWLLAPLVASTLASLLTGSPAPVGAEALSPSRFEAQA